MPEYEPVSEKYDSIDGMIERTSAPAALLWRDP
jgi:hypothetical protein